MTYYVFDPEEKEYVEVTRPPRYVSRSNGVRPLSSAEIHKRQLKETAAARVRAGREIPREKGVRESQNKNG